MQHVNVCLQALLKMLGKSCREQEQEGRQEKVERERERDTGNEKQRVPVLSVADDSRDWAARGTTPPPPPTLHNQLPPSSTSSFPRASGKAHDTLHLSPNTILSTQSDQSTSRALGPQKPER